MATFTIAPDYSSPLSVKPRVLSAAFGDGYTQRAQDGINTDPEMWALTFSNRTAAERDALLAFLAPLKGTTAFDWTSPSGRVGKFICPEYGFTPNSAATNTVTARFEQVYDL